MSFDQNLIYYVENRIMLYSNPIYYTFTVSNYWPQ